MKIKSRLHAQMFMILQTFLVTSFCGRDGKRLIRIPVLNAELWANLEH